MDNKILLIKTLVIGTAIMFVLVSYSSVEADFFINPFIENSVESMKVTYEKSMINYESNNGTWWRILGGLYYDFGYCLQQTTDGGYIISGETEPLADNDIDGFLIKTDANGIKLWDKFFGEYYPIESILSVYQTFDSGYILVGYIAADYNDTSLWLIKTDTYGNEIWNKTYKFNGMTIGKSVFQTYDDGYLILGEISHNHLLLFKVDKNGNELWKKIYRNFIDDNKYINQTIDGGFIIAGVIYNESLNYSYPWLLKLDLNGQEQWNKTYNLNQDIKWKVRDVLQTNDGGYAIIGTKNDDSHYFSYGYMIKTDKDGNKEWIKDYITIFGYNWPYSFYQTSDGGYILTGQTFNIFKFNIIKKEGVIGLWLAKTDESGNIKWSRSYGKKYANFPITSCYGASVLQISDGGYVVLGNSKLLGTTEDVFDIWLFKTDKNGVYAKTRTSFQVYDMMNYRFLERFPILQKLLNM